MDDVEILRAGDHNKEVVGFNIAVYGRVVMDRLNPGNLILEQKTENKGRSGRDRESRDSPLASQHTLSRMQVPFWNCAIHVRCHQGEHVRFEARHFDRVL